MTVRPRASGLLAILIPALLAACSEPVAQQYVIDGKTYSMGKDVACLERETSGSHLPIYRAVTICGTALPDLTGDGKLQRAAYAWNVPFHYNRTADAAIKRKFPYTPTGSLIANVAPDLSFEGGPYD